MRRAWSPNIRRFPIRRRSDQDVATDVSNLIEAVHSPEAEISVIEGQTKVIKTRRDLTRIVISNPLIADVELLTDQPGSRLLNVYGKSFGTTSLTMWDQTNRPVSFLVRVSLDTNDLSSRIRQGFPGADVKVRQVGPQIILDGQVPDSKTMADIIQLVTFTLMSSPSFRTAGGGMGMMGGGGGGAVQRWRRGPRGTMIINRVTVPGPRQVMLHVKIAEINRSATRSIGVSWLYARGNSLLGSVAGNNGTITTAATAGIQPDVWTARFRKAHSGDLWLDGNVPRRRPTRRCSACSTRGISRYSSTPCAPTTWRRSWPSPIWSHLTASPRGFWWAACSPSRFPRARRYRAERPW